MPVAFRYVGSESPPAPYVLVAVARTGGGGAIPDLPAKVDSGADRTVIPTRIATQLGLDEVGRHEFEGLNGIRVTLSITRLQLAIRGCDAIEVEAALSDGESHILLGRDVLSYYRVTLDGPKAKVEIG